MSKSRIRAKEEFRYQRVDLPRADSSSEDEDDLDKVLGPSSRSSTRGSKYKRCKVFCTIFTVLLTIGALASVVIFGTVVFPGSIQEALRQGQSWLGIMENNSTTNETVNDDFNFTMTTDFSEEMFETTTYEVDHFEESLNNEEKLEESPKTEEEMSSGSVEAISSAVSQESFDTDFTLHSDGSLKYDHDSRDLDFKTYDEAQHDDDFFYSRESRGMVDRDYDPDSYNGEYLMEEPIPLLEDYEKKVLHRNKKLLKSTSTTTTTRSFEYSEEIEEIDEAKNSTESPAQINDEEITTTDEMEVSWPETIWVITYWYHSAWRFSTLLHAYF